MPEQIHIFLIEDDSDDREFLEVALTDHGISYRLDVANRGDLAMQYISEGSILPDIIIMDLNIPKVHGKDVLCALRQNRLYDATPVLVLTTSNSESDRDFCMKKGADEFFSKPSDTDGFRSLILAILKLAGKVAGQS